VSGPAESDDTRGKLELERARLAELLKRSPTLLTVMRGPEHVYELVNDAFLDLIGGRDVIGRPLAEALPELADQGFVELIDRVLETGEPSIGHEVRVRFERTPGEPHEERLIDFVFLPLTEADGNRSGVVGHGTDVTEHVHARREIERLLAETVEARAAAEEARSAADDARQTAEKVARTKSEFLATVSHEIRTPINAILGYSELLDLGLAGPLTEAQREHLGRLRTSGEHLLTLVSELLDMAKLDAGRMLVTREHALSGDAVRAALTLVLPQAQARNVALVVEGADEPGVPYVGDAYRVQQILVNLLMNAVKFTPEGGTVSVACTLETEVAPEARAAGPGPWARIRVSDTGSGIEVPRQVAVFEPYVQAEAGQARTAGGTGLGLTISRRLARLMGGDLVLEGSTPGEGSVFALWLPSSATSQQMTGDAQESTEDEAMQASRQIAAYGVQGLGAVAVHLRNHMEEVIEAFVASLRREPSIPEARRRTRAELEDHTTTLISNLTQSLVIIESEGGLQSEMLKDGGEIQRVLADLHGRQRRRLGWTESDIRREYEILAGQILSLVARRVPDGAGDVDTALEVLHRLLERAAETSVQAFRHAPAE
jgi:PAS domain S-box-containing protein